MDRERSRLNSKTYRRDSNKKILWIFLGVIIGVIVLAIVVISVSNPSFTNNNSQNSSQNTCKDVQVPYTEEEGYYESEPYTDQECNTRELQSYTEQFIVNIVCTDRNFWGTCTRENVQCVYTLKNIDNAAGTWTIGMKLKNLDLMSEVDLGTQSAYIPQSISKTLTWVYSTNRISDKFTCLTTLFQAPTTTECHDVIKYRDVYKTRTVTKYRTETQCG